MSGSSRTSSGPRFLIIRLGSLGDVIHGIPAAAALRRRFPQAQIDWLVDPLYVSLLDLVDGIDRRIPFDPRGLMRGRDAWSVVHQLRRTRYDAVVDFQGLLKSAILARLTGAGKTIGLSRRHLREPLASLFYSMTDDAGEAVHVIDKALNLVQLLGVVDRTTHFPIAIPRTTASTAVADRMDPQEYALLNPGAAWPNKRWPADRFGALAAAIRDEFNLRSVVLWGPGEQSLAAEVAAQSRGAAEPAPATTIPDIVAIAGGAKFMVSGDTGPLHIGGAVGTPLVALFGPTYPERNGPWSPRDITLSRVTTCICRYERRCRRDSPCINEIGLDQVVRAVRERLSLHG